MTILKRFRALILLAAMAACAPRAPAPELPTGKFPIDFPSSFYSTVPRADLFHISPSRSKLTIKVFRAGALATLGHNHVIISHELDGFIYLADDMSKARADLFAPVTSFGIDDAAERAAAGSDFTTQPSPSDIEGTRANMLGPKLLDAQQWPFVVVHVAPMHVGTDSTQVQLSITVCDKTATVPVDARWKRTGKELTIESAFKIDHATLGLTPFSALGGALRVADQIDIAVSIVAEAAH
jgi:hypothetical protein